MTVAPGESLQKLDPPYSLVESISFSINLLSIIKSFHEKGIVHRDLKPENIQIDWTDNAQSLANAHITVLDFGLAYIENRTRNKLIPSEDIDFEQVQKEEQERKLQETSPGVVLGNRWYRVPQLRSQGSAKLSGVAQEKLVQARRSPTIDTSSVCAILFWLLTGVIPAEEDDNTTNRTEKKQSSTKRGTPVLYHQKEEKMLMDIVKNTVQGTNRGQLCFFSVPRSKSTVFPNMTSAVLESEPSIMYSMKFSSFLVKTSSLFLIPLTLISSLYF
jgi:serine/threonine protein kinase